MMFDRTPSAAPISLKVQPWAYNSAARLTSTAPPAKCPGHLRVHYVGVNRSATTPSAFNLATSDACCSRVQPSSQWFAEVSDAPDFEDAVAGAVGVAEMPDTGVG